MLDTIGPLTTALLSDYTNPNDINFIPSCSMGSITLG